MIDHPICEMILAFPKTENSYYNLFLISLFFFSFYDQIEIYFKAKTIKFQVLINLFLFEHFLQRKKFSFDEILKINAVMTRLMDN